MDEDGRRIKAAAVEGMLKAMAAKGCLLWRQSQGSWALMPFVVGMFEMQIARLTKPLYDDAVDYLKTGFGLELLTTGEAQSRIIPIGAAIRPEHRIADYDEFRRLIRACRGPHSCPGLHLPPWCRYVWQALQGHRPPGVVHGLP
jgi:hypothetical protein